MIDYEAERARLMEAGLWDEGAEERARRSVRSMMKNVLTPAEVAEVNRATGARPAAARLTLTETRYEGVTVSVDCPAPAAEHWEAWLQKVSGSLGGRVTRRR